MNFPKEAKKVFNGVLHDVYQWEQLMFDGTYATFEGIARRSTCDVIAVTPEKKILICMQEQPRRPLFPSTPGGRLDPGEQPVDAAKRELLEETGYTSEEFVLMNEYFGYSDFYFPCYQFVAKNCVKVAAQNLDGGEKIIVKELTFSDFIELCRDPKFVTIPDFKLEMYEMLLDEDKKDSFRRAILGD